MKKILLAAILGCGILTANADNPVTDGSSYFLPKTALRFTLFAREDHLHPR